MPAIKMSDAYNGSPNDDLVVTAAYGVGPSYVQGFIASLRKVNPHCRVVFLVSDDQPLAEIARRYSCTLSKEPWLFASVPRVRVSFTNGIGQRITRPLRVTEIVGRRISIIPKCARYFPSSFVRLMVSVLLARWFHVRDLISTENGEGHILVADCRDVLFQDDPFRDRAKLEVAQEHHHFGNGSCNDLWYSSAFGDSEFSKIKGLPVYNVGTVLGHTSLIKEYVNAMCQTAHLMRTWRWAGVEQAAYNLIMHGPGFVERLTASNHLRGSIATTGVGAPFQEAGGFVVDETGRPFPIVHQYDRLPESVRSNLVALHNKYQ